MKQASSKSSKLFSYRFRLGQISLSSESFLFNNQIYFKKFAQNVPHAEGTGSSFMFIQNVNHSHGKIDTT